MVEALEEEKDSAKDFQKKKKKKETKKMGKNNMKKCFHIKMDFILSFYKKNISK